MSKTRRPWMTWEYAILEKYYPTGGVARVLAEGVDRTPTAIKGYARYKGIVNRPELIGKTNSKIGFVVNGVRDSIAGHCRRLGIVSRHTVYNRTARHGWDVERAITTPPFCFGRPRKVQI